MRINCSYENNEFADMYSVGERNGVVLELHSPSQLSMGERPSIVLDSEGIDNMIKTLKKLKGEISL